MESAAREELPVVYEIKKNKTKPKFVMAEG